MGEVVETRGKTFLTERTRSFQSGSTVRLLLFEEVSLRVCETKAMNIERKNGKKQFFYFIKNESLTKIICTFDS